MPGCKVQGGRERKEAYMMMCPLFSPLTLIPPKDVRLGRQIALRRARIFEWGRQCSDQKNQFYSFIKQIPNILECDVVTGPYAMLLKVAYKIPEELDDLVNKLQRFGKTNTMMVFSTPVRPRGFFFEIH
uniref:Lrp/AsnC ligand binding domain-containing protein n=1 Tax=Lentilactobacillus hilgardii TaxID=1588 RepID=UPI00403F4917